MSLSYTASLHASRDQTYTAGPLETLSLNDGLDGVQHLFRTKAVIEATTSSGPEMLV